jgi:hypothetical protein
LGKPVHPLPYFDEHVSFVYKWGKVVLFHDGLGNVFGGDSHVFKVWHGGIQVKISYVGRHEFCVVGGEYTIEEDFYEGHASYGGADRAVVVDSIATAGESDSVLARFMWAVVCTYAEVCCLAICWECRDGDEMYGIGAMGHVWIYALCESSYFVGGSAYPCFRVCAEFELRVFLCDAGVWVDYCIGCPVCMGW